MSELTTFRLSFFDFLDRYPLYSYRDRTGALNILLVGNGQRMLEELLPAVATNGQLLDTALHITLACPNPERSMELLLQNAPWLPHFAALSCAGQTVLENERDDVLCTIAFEGSPLEQDNIAQLDSPCRNCPYILISTGSDEKNAALAQALGEHVCDRPTLIAYVQRKKPAVLPAVRSECTVLVPFGFDGIKTELPKELEKIGLNLHASYAKSADSRCSVRQILSDFYNDEYTYASNIEAAIHVKAKLLSCGIDCSDLDQAAKEFSDRLANDPALLSRLSAVEHNRWVLSKIFAGYRQLQDYDLIYQNGNTTHSTTQKWHTCLLPSDHTGVSVLTEKAWQAAEAGIAPDPKLDPLDRMTLILHQKCKERADACSSTVNSLLKTLRELLAEDLDLSLAASDAFDQLSLSVSELRMHKKSAHSLYQRSWRNLYDQIRTNGGARTSTLVSVMDSLRAETGALVEYVSRKDYKEQDRILCRGIPYALTHVFCPAVMKLLSERMTENIAAIQQMDPDAITFVGIAQTPMEFAQLQNTLSNLKRYTRRYLPESTVRYSILLPIARSGMAGEEREDVVFVPSLERKALANELDSLFPAAPAYIDTTGASPLLIAAALEYADCHSCGVFYSCSGTFQNISRAEELEYPFPKQPFTVGQMFDLSGADTISVESDRITGLENVYRELWNIVSVDSLHWKSLLKKISTQSEEQTSSPQRPAALPDDRMFRFSFAGEGDEVTLQMQPDTLQKLFPLLRRLAKLNYLRDFSTSLTYGATRILRFTVLPGITDVPLFQKEMQRFCNDFDPQTMFFDLNYNNSALLMCGLRYSISLADDTPLYLKCHKDILQKLADIHCIYDLTCDDEQRCSFRLASPEMRHIIEKEGNAAETYVYYTALLECGFDDVENGLYFRHAVGSEMRNEIDVICTGGGGSLFVSVKDRNETALAANDLDYLNMIAYEIRYEAEHFGLNGKAVLAAPALPIYTLSQNGTCVLSAYAKKCRSRGVYLCGKECFQSGMLGRSLTAVLHDTDGSWCEFLRPVRKPAVTTPVAERAFPSKPSPDSFSPAILRFDELKIGQVYYGKVINIDRGLTFVDIGVRGCNKMPLNGAVPLREVSDKYIRNINDVLHVNDILKVKVIALNPSASKFDLSIRQAEKA